MNAFEIEKRALTGGRMEVIQVVSALRRYRESVKFLLSKRHGDGECDGLTLTQFADMIEVTEDEFTGEKD